MSWRLGSVSAFSDNLTRPPRPAAPLWRPAGLAWAVANLAALAVGMFPQWIVSPWQLNAAAPLPTLRTLAVGQVAFLLLAGPLLLAKRPTTWGDRLGEMAIWLLVALPFLAAAAYVADATIQDAVRVTCLTLSVFVAVWGLASLARRGGGGMSLAVLAGVLVVLGGPGANYLAREFGSGVPPGWLWHLFPVTQAYSTAAAREAFWLPRPLWAWLLPAGVGIALLLLGVILPPGRRADDA